MNQVKALEFVRDSLGTKHDDEFLSDILTRVIEDMKPDLSTGDIDVEGMKTRLEILYQKKDQGHVLEPWEETVLYMDSQRGGCYY